MKRHAAIAALTMAAHSAVAQTLPVQIVNSCTPVTSAPPNTYTKQTVLYETTSDGQSEYLDLYTPNGISKPTMAMVIHGGGFVSGDKAAGNIASLALGMVSLGWQVASINYRLSGVNGFANLFPAPLQDAICALQWLKTSGLGDDRHIVVAGLSAGGGMANWIGTVARQHNPAFLSESCHSGNDTADDVAGIASFYGFSDFANPAVYNSLNNLNRWDQTLSVVAQAVGFQPLQRADRVLQRRGE